MHFKAYYSSNVNNYRPIAIQPAVAKLFESLDLDDMSFMFDGSVSIPEQNGFRPGKSTVTNSSVY